MDTAFLLTGVTSVTSVAGVAGVPGSYGRPGRFLGADCNHSMCPRTAPAIFPATANRCSWAPTRTYLSTLGRRYMLLGVVDLRALIGPAGLGRPFMRP